MGHPWAGSFSSFSFSASSLFSLSRLGASRRTFVANAWDREPRESWDLGPASEPRVGRALAVRCVLYTGLLSRGTARGALPLATCTGLARSVIPILATTMELRARYCTLLVFCWLPSTCTCRDPLLYLYVPWLCVRTCLPVTSLRFPSSCMPYT